MQLVLELLKKIFVALQGVYTKAETDEITAPIDYLKVAVDGDWKSYMLARAGMTGIQANIDTVNRAIKEYGEDNTAALPNRLIEDWTNLYGYDAWVRALGGVSPLNAKFWTEYFVALAKWEAEPTATTTWDVVDGVSTNPYATGEGDTYVVDFSVTSCKGVTPTPSFSATRSYKAVYLPNCTVWSNAFYGCSGTVRVITPKATSITGVAYKGTGDVLDVYTPSVTSLSYGMTDVLFGKIRICAENATNANNLFSNSSNSVYNSTLTELTLSLPQMTTGAYLVPVYSPKLASVKFFGGTSKWESASSAFSGTPIPAGVAQFQRIEGVDVSNIKTARSFVARQSSLNQAFSFPSLTDGSSAFFNAGLSAANIATTLDSLPTRTAESGGTGVITFTGCPGAAELTQDSPSVASAVAKGWTVEL